MATAYRTVYLARPDGQGAQQPLAPGLSGVGLASPPILTVSWPQKQDPGNSLGPAQRPFRARRQEVCVCACVRACVRVLCSCPSNVLHDLIIHLQMSLSGARCYEPSFIDSRTERMSALSCGACSSPPPSCPESSAQPNECIRCTVPGLSAATNYTVTVTALSGAGTGASSDKVTKQTEACGELATLHGSTQGTCSYWVMTTWCIALAQCLQ